MKRLLSIAVVAAVLGVGIWAYLSAQALASFVPAFRSASEEHRYYRVSIGRRYEHDSIAAYHEVNLSVVHVRHASVAEDLPHTLTGRLGRRPFLA